MEIITFDELLARAALPTVRTVLGPLSACTPYLAVMTPSPATPRTFTDAEVAVTAAQAGADVIRRAYGTRQQRIAKSSKDFATGADLASERAVFAVLIEHRPGDAREGEELGLSGDSAARRRWLVDPLCGTANFAATTPLMSVNVALTEEENVLAAASADPIAKEVFWTDGGQTARLLAATGDAPMTPSATTRLVDVNCDGPLDMPFVGGQLLADPALRAAWAPRVVSTTLAVAWVAAGRRAAYVTDGHLAGSVHFTAGIALCRAAKCVVTDLAGRPIHAAPGLIAAADEATHADIVGWSVLTAKRSRIPGPDHGLPAVPPSRAACCSTRRRSSLGHVLGLGPHRRDGLEDVA